MQVIINNQSYDLLVGYQKDAQRRKAFNELAQKTFKFSFEFWFKAGYWNNKYIPYTLFDGDSAVANISVNIMNFKLNSTTKLYIQIGTVMTDESYRNLGLSRFLMTHVLKTWKGKCDLVYLLANQSVLNMYPKFGFTPVKEYACFIEVASTEKSLSYEKMNMDDQTKRNMLCDYIKNSQAFSKLSMRDGSDLVMFYCLSLLKDNVFYCRELDAVVIATFHDHQAQLWDVFCPHKLPLNRIINSFACFNVKKVQLGFTPIAMSSCEIHEVLGEDTLFVQTNGIHLFEHEKLMFPMLSHA